MLDMGFLPDIKRIIALLPKERQNLLFSATFPDEIRTLAKTLLRNPAEITVTPRNVAAELVTHVVHPVAREKMESLAAIERLIKKRIERILVPGFQPSGATVATLMGDQPTRRSPPAVRRDRPVAKPSDPIFSKPYEPGAGTPAPPKAEAPQPPRRKQPQVAALLGGRKRA